MSFTWEQEVALCLIKRLLDPELVHYFLKILKPLHNEFVFQEAKEFHCSLRLTMEDRKKKLVENKENRDFHLMNPGVPITFPLPFNCIEWRYMKINFIMVRLLVEGFMVEYNMSLDKRGLQALKDQSISEKIITINKLTKDLVYSQPDYLRRNFVYNTLKEFEDANKEFIDCMGETEYGVMDGDYPTLLTTIDSSGNSICVIVG